MQPNTPIECVAFPWYWTVRTDIEARSYLVSRIEANPDPFERGSAICHRSSGERFYLFAPRSEIGFEMFGADPESQAVRLHKGIQVKGLLECKHLVQNSEIEPILQKGRSFCRRILSEIVIIQTLEIEPVTTLISIKREIVILVLTKQRDSRIWANRMPEFIKVIHRKACDMGAQNQINSTCNLGRGK